MVIATQNLVESHGTFPLPNSQLDRFLVSTSIGLPTPQQELEILSRSEHGLPEVAPVLSVDEVVEMQDTVRQVQVALPVRQYIVNLVGATREHPAVVVGVSPRGGGGAASGGPGMGGLRWPGFRGAGRCKGSRAHGSESPCGGRWRCGDAA